MTLEFKQEQLTGGNCSGSDGDSNRILTLSNLKETSEDEFNIYLDGLFLQLDEDYSINHKVSSTEITFLLPVWDSQRISVDYFQFLTKSEVKNKRQDLQSLISNNGQTFTLKRYTETTDTMGGVTDKTTESYTIYSILQNITKKDRKIHEMGLAVTGNMKAVFYHEYPDSITGNGILKVKVGDILEEEDGKQWRIESITAERYVAGSEIFRVGVVRSINLEE